MIDIERALATPGFMAQVELEYLANIAKSAQTILEIGSWQGRSARAFADNTPGCVWCVDTWADNAYGSAPTEITSRPNWLMDAFSRNHSDTIGIKVIRVRETSIGAFKHLSHMLFDIIFIDAGHNYEDVKSDILTWRSLLRPGGIMCGHDFAEYHPGVIQAVNEFYPTHAVIGTIWEAA